MCFGACLFPFPGSLVFLDCFSRKPTTPSSFGFVATSQSAFSIRHLLWRWTPGAWPLRTVELPKLRRAAGPPKGVTWLSGHGNRDGRHGRVVVGIFSAYFAPENEIHDLKKNVHLYVILGRNCLKSCSDAFWGEREVCTWNNNLFGKRSHLRLERNIFKILRKYQTKEPAEASEWSTFVGTMNHVCGGNYETPNHPTLLPRKLRCPMKNRNSSFKMAPF